MNEPVAWMQTWENQDGFSRRTVNIEQIGKNDIPLYTQDQLEEARKLGMQQERALWNLSASTQEIMDTHPVKELTDEDWGDRKDQWTDAIQAEHPLNTKDYKTYEMAMEMVGNRHGKFALVSLVNYLLRKAQEK